MGPETGKEPAKRKGGREGGSAGQEGKEDRRKLQWEEEVSQRPQRNQIFVQGMASSRVVFFKHCLWLAQHSCARCLCILALHGRSTRTHGPELRSANSWAMALRRCSRVGPASEFTLFPVGDMLKLVALNRKSSFRYVAHCFWFYFRNSE